MIWDTLNQSVITGEDRKELINLLDLATILEVLLRGKHIADAEAILSWPGAADEPAIVRTLVSYGQTSMARGVLAARNIGLSPEDLHFAIESQ